MWRGRLGLRRLHVLLANLPHDSATRRALEESEAWSTTDYLLANVIDLLQAANWQRGGDKKAPRPKPVPRPGAKKTSESAIEARARAFRARNAKEG